MSCPTPQSSVTSWASRGMGDGDLYESNYWDGGGDWYYDPSTGEVYQSGGGSGSGDLPTGGLTEWWNLWYGTPSPLDQFNASDYGPPIVSINTFDTYPGAASWWNDIANWFTGPTDPGSLDPIPIDWTQIGTSIGPCSAGQTEVYTSNGTRCVDSYLATNSVPCPGGQYNDPSNPARCIPFPPSATPQQKAALTQQGQQAAIQAQQKAQQSQQAALQQAAQQCAALGGQLVRNAQGQYICQRANGTQQSLSTSSLGGIPLWILILIGVVVLSK